MESGPVDRTRVPTELSRSHFTSCLWLKLVTERELNSIFSTNTMWISSEILMMTTTNKDACTQKCIRNSHERQLSQAQWRSFTCEINWKYPRGQGRWFQWLNWQLITQIRAYRRIQSVAYKKVNWYSISVIHKSTKRDTHILIWHYLVGAISRHYAPSIQGAEHNQIW